jgi:hypothetical protein
MRARNNETREGQGSGSSFAYFVPSGAVAPGDIHRAKRREIYEQ